MSGRVFKVLFLCTGNSARSILAEALLNTVGAGRFRAYSAGSQPLGRVNPLVIELLQGKGMSIAGLRSKSWDEFAHRDSPQMDIVVTVCDNAAGESCPVWPGAPITAHWRIDDPAAVQGSEEARRQAFAAAFDSLQRRVSAFAGLALNGLDAAAIEQKVREIGSVHRKERAHE